jgi:hypothetical protein
MTQYDPKVIYKFATRLYSRAQTLVLSHTLIGALVGGILGKAYSAYVAAVTTWNNMAASPSNTFLGALGMGRSNPQPSLPPTTDWTLIGILIVGLIGFWIGWNKAFILKLQAQTALCQAKIEENTNPTNRKA